MFDIGFWELLVIGIVLLLVLGPERLPEVARQAAFLVRKARRGMYRLRSEMQGEIDGTPFADLQAARREMTDFKNDMRQFGRELADSAEKQHSESASKSAAVAEGSPAKSVTPDRETAQNSSASVKKAKKKARKKAVKKSASADKPSSTKAQAPKNDKTV